MGEGEIGLCALAGREVGEVLLLALVVTLGVADEEVQPDERLGTAFARVDLFGRICNQAETSEQFLLESE